MRILFLTTAHNSLSQRAWVELTDRGHEVSVELAVHDRMMIEAVQLFHPDLIVAPMLKKFIPKVIWSQYTCLIIHPGIPGDKGPSSLDWAILQGLDEWGVTVIEANGEYDSGDIWASETFAMRPASKSSLYRREVTDAAIHCLLQAVERFETGNYLPETVDYDSPEVKGRPQPPMKQTDRRINWQDSTETILRRLRSSDSSPGVLDELHGANYYLFGGYEEGALRGMPGDILAWRDGAICRATGDGAVWITHLQQRLENKGKSLKLPATHVLRNHLHGVPPLPLAVDAVCDAQTYREIWYEEQNEVGYLHFDFASGAMSTEQCLRLRAAYSYARQRPTKVIVLMGGTDFFSNGIHLHMIEAAKDPADESWRNILAIDDLVRDILLTDSQLVISALQGNAAAGGVMLALAADRVCVHNGVVLNPHYKTMGLYGSEYWTYLLPKRVGRAQAVELTEQCLPVSARTAEKIGLVDVVFDSRRDTFCAEIAQMAEGLAQSEHFQAMLAEKRKKRMQDESVKALESYRREELEWMQHNFYHAHSTYHVARKNFVYKTTPLETPRHFALHRQRTRPLQ